MPETLRFCRKKPAILYFAAQQKFRRIRIVNFNSLQVMSASSALQL
jgi:hypothetical protein